MRLHTIEDTDLEYHGDLFHLVDVISHVTDEDARTELVEAINTADGENIPVSESALNAFYDAVSSMTVE